MALARLLARLRVPDAPPADSAFGAPDNAEAMEAYGAQPELHFTSQDGVAVTSALSLAFRRMGDGEPRTAVSSRPVSAPCYFEVLIGQLGKGKFKLDAEPSPTEPIALELPLPTPPPQKRRRSLFSRPPPSPPPDPTLPNSYLVSVGFILSPESSTELPGLAPSSIGFFYSPYEGCFVSTCFSSSGDAEKKTKKYAIKKCDVGMDSKEPLHIRSGDIIGLGISRHGVFFTLNGQLIHFTRTKSNDYFPLPCSQETRHGGRRTVRSVYPALGANGAAQLLVNFGASEFVWRAADGEVGLPGYDPPPAYWD